MMSLASSQKKLCPVQKNMDSLPRLRRASARLEVFSAPPEGLKRPQDIYTKTCSEALELVILSITDTFDHAHYNIGE